MKIHLSSPDKLKEAMAHLSSLDLNGSIMIEFKKIPNKRTLLQNASLHRWLEMLSQEFNKGGLSVQQVLAEAVEREWDMMTAKKQLWKPVQEQMTGKKSSADATREEYIKVYEVLNRHFGEKFGIHVPWPNKNAMNGVRK